MITTYLLSCFGQVTAKTFRSLSQTGTRPVPTCLPQTAEASHCLFYCSTSSKEVMDTIFIVFDLTRLRIEPESTVSVADPLSTRPLMVPWPP